MVKGKSKVVLVPAEMPLGKIHLRNMYVPLYIGYFNPANVHFYKTPNH